jgi:hypothetical protein
MVIKNFDSNLCTLCEYSITDPICSDCYIRQTAGILYDLKINSMIIHFISNKLKKKFLLETLNYSCCISCNKNRLNICGYCFSVILIGILKELNFSEDLIGNFEHSKKCENFF